MTQQQYRNRWRRQHAQYERLAYSLFSQSFVDTANQIPFDAINEENYEAVVDDSINREDITSAYFQVYNEIGKIHGVRTGKSINKQIKEFNLNTFLNAFERNLISWLFDNAGSRIVSVRDTYARFIISFITRGITEGKAIAEIVRELKKTINGRNWYRWQLLRIARTETTAAANHSATVATQISGVVADKVWISVEDPRTRKPPFSRYNHLAMNGVRIPQSDQFNVNGDMIDFPGDPKGEAGNIINCRCSSAVVVRRDSQGRIIRLTES